MKKKKLLKLIEEMKDKILDAQYLLYDLKNNLGDFSYAVATANFQEFVSSGKHIRKLINDIDELLNEARSLDRG